MLALFFLCVALVFFYSALPETGLCNSSLPPVAVPWRGEVECDKYRLHVFIRCLIGGITVQLGSPCHAVSGTVSTSYGKLKWWALQPVTS